jgi:hypothetical protein
MIAGDRAVDTRQAAINTLVVIIKHASMEEHAMGQGVTPRQIIAMGLAALTTIGVDEMELARAAGFMIRTMD